jgi:septal ring-binding cell division protein DamX
MKNSTILLLFIAICLLGTTKINAQNSTNSSISVRKLIAKKRAFNKKYGYGYRIQLYYGNETKARSTQSKFKVLFPGVYTKLDYNQPYWKVLVGNYKTKLEADKAMISFSEKFSGLIAIPLGK